jgi:type 1 glutamine amidotransferase
MTIRRLTVMSMQAWTVVACVGISSVVAMADEPPARPEPIHALLITGHNNHNWQYTSRVHKETLEGTGRFQVDITEDPATTLADAGGLKKYQVFVLDYNDSQAPKRWGEPGGAAEKNFAAAVQSGTGVCAIHSADNAFNGWKEYEQMLGLMWREGTGHGAFHEFNVEIVDKDHPITKGMSNFNMHPDELYHKLVNSQKTTPHLLMQAMDDGQGGSKQIEPMAFTLEYGKGRIFATPLGHVWTNDQKSKKSVLDPQFKTLLCRGAEWAATGAVTLGAEWKDVRTHNLLTGDETMSGWKLLFDGTRPSVDANFRGYKQEKFPEKGWSVKEGALVHAPGGEGGDILTKGEYADFEFECQWKVAKGGNSGIMYHVTEENSQPYESGPEMQILDDEAHSTSAKKNLAGSYYDMFPCLADVCRPAGEWNTARIVVKGKHEQFFLNGVKVIDADSSSEEYKKALAESKWAKVPTFNASAKGHIDLQNHGDEVWFRDVKVREVK